MTAKSKLHLFFVVYFLIGVGLIVNIIRLIRPMELATNSTSTPIVIHRENDLLLTHISQIVSDETYIYVLYGDYSVVQAYSHDGSYQYSISVCNYANGRTKIAVHDNYLYVCDKVENVYIFQNDEFIRFVDGNESSEIKSKIVFGRSDPHYSVRGSSIWYIPDNAYPYCIINRPAWLAIYQNDFHTLILFSLAILAGAILFAPKRAK